MTKPRPIVPAPTTTVAELKEGDYLEIVHAHRNVRGTYFGGLDQKGRILGDRVEIAMEAHAYAEQERDAGRVWSGRFPAGGIVIKTRRSDARYVFAPDTPASTR